MPASDAGRAFALVLVDELARHGVMDAVLAPGSRSTPIALALLEHPQIRVHVRIDERSAAYLALGIARTSGRIVPVLCTSGTAAAHFHGAVLEADLSRVPLLVLTADRPPELRGIGANQTVDQVGLYGTAPRWACDVSVPETRPDSVREWRSLISLAAARCLGTGGPTIAPGPVHLNLPLREPLLPGDDDRFPFDLAGRADGMPWTQSTRVDVTSAGELTALLAPVRRGIVVAGDTLSMRQGRAVAEFANRAAWPLFAEPHSNARQGGSALRCTDNLLRDNDFMAAHRPDGVIVIGRVGLSRALLGWLAQVPHIVIDPAGGWWDITRTADAILTADPVALVDVTVSDSEAGWLDDWLAASSRVGATIDAVLDATALLSEPRTARDVAAMVPDGAALVVASSMPIRDLDLVMRPRSTVRIVASRGVSGIDGFTSTAQGVALVHDSRVYALCGDLSLLHDSNGLLPGPDLRPDITYVVINNDGGGIFSTMPQGGALDSATFERLFGTPPGVSLARLAAAYDATHTVATTPDELEHALAAFGGVRIVEVRTDRTENAYLQARIRAG